MKNIKVKPNKQTLKFKMKFYPQITTYGTYLLGSINIKFVKRNMFHNFEFVYKINTDI